MSLSSAAAELCVSPTYFNASLRMVNFDKNHCFNLTVHPGHSKNDFNYTCVESWFDKAPNISAIPASPIEMGQDIWVYKSQPELNSSLPITKPLLIDCPMPVCAFGISGSYADLQRYLIYTNVLFALIASAAPILRGIAQGYLITTGLSATIHFWVILNLQHEGYIDLDFFPSLSFGLSGVVAIQFWILLRSHRMSSTRDLLIYLGLPWIFAMVYFIIFIIVMTSYNYTPWAVLLESDTAFRLTSICYQDSPGSVAVWSGHFHSGIRQISELQLLLPWGGSDGKSATVIPVSSNEQLVIAIGGLSLYMLLLIISGVKKKCGFERSSWEINLSFLGYLPRVVQRLFSPGFSSSDWIKNQRLVFRSHFSFMMGSFAPTLIAYVLYVIFLERGIRHHHLPLGEAPYQYSQWSTWVMTFFVAFATIILQARKKPSDNKCDHKDYSSAFSDESAIRIEDQHSFRRASY